MLAGYTVTGNHVGGHGNSAQNVGGYSKFTKAGSGNFNTTSSAFGISIKLSATKGPFATAIGLGGVGKTVSQTAPGVSFG